MSSWKWTTANLSKSAELTARSLPSIRMAKSTTILWPPDSLPWTGIGIRRSNGDREEGGGKLEHLLEPALKGVSFEALGLAKVDQHTALWLANSNGMTIQKGPPTEAAYRGIK